MFSLNDVRDFQEFDTKKQAMKFALKIKAKGAEKIFLDTYDDDDDLVDYQHILEGAWIKHSKPSKFSGTLSFNKGDQDSIANPKNKSIVPFRGINKKWGIS
jgi:hypothetical protein